MAKVEALGAVQVAALVRVVVRAVELVEVEA